MSKEKEINMSKARLDIFDEMLLGNGERARLLVEEHKIGTKNRFKVQTETHKIEPIKYEEQDD